MDENWKDIPGYEGRYQASDLGRIRSLLRREWRKNAYGAVCEWSYSGRVLRIGRKGCGHYSVALGANNTQLVHRLVLMAFVGLPQQGQECRHLDGNSGNNRLENLVWGSRVENRADTALHAEMYRRRQGSSWLSEDTIRQIKQDLAAPDCPSQKELAKKYGVHYNTISNINRKFTHKWVGTE